MIECFCSRSTNFHVFAKNCLNLCVLPFKFLFLYLDRILIKFFCIPFCHFKFIYTRRWSKSGFYFYQYLAIAWTWT
jgi:hypothetical protein